jgi:hypothetical protein
MNASKLIFAVLFAAAGAAAPLAAGARVNNGHEDSDISEGGGHEYGDRGRGENGEGDRKHGGHGGGPGGRKGDHGQDPEMREQKMKLRGLESKLQELHRKIRQSSDSEKAAVKTEARNLIGEIFDAKLAMEMAMLTKMEKHMAELKEKIAKKKSNREKMIDSKLVRMMGEGEDEW